MFNPIRRTFLASIPVMFAGLFGVGRAKTSESPPEPKTYEYRVIKDYADGTGGTIDIPWYYPNSAGQATQQAQIAASELPSHGGGSVWIERAEIGPWKMVPWVKIF